MKLKKSFGQHFLTDQQILSDIVDYAQLKENEQVWEIGPGSGNLTDYILKKNVKLTCFEIDRDLYPILKSKYDNQINLIERDIIKVKWDELLTGNHYKIVSNLPYQITSPFLFKVIKHHQYFDSLVIMIQKEVAQRICSLPNKKDYGVLSLKIQYYFHTEYLMSVAPEKFTPPPKVDSSVIKLTPRTDQPKIDDIQLFWKIVDIAFGNRRKMLRNNLKVLNYNTEYTQIANNSPIDFNRRGETLSEEDFYNLYLYLQPFINS